MQMLTDKLFILGYEYHHICMASLDCWSWSIGPYRAARKGTMAVGEQVTEDFRIAGRRGTVVWTVVDRNAPKYWAIEGKVEGTDSGGRITYTLLPTAEGTTFERAFVYNAPSVRFYLANWLKLQKLNTTESEEAIRRLKQKRRPRGQQPPGPTVPVPQ